MEQINIHGHSYMVGSNVSTKRVYTQLVHNTVFGTDQLPPYTCQTTTDYMETKYP